MADRDGRGRLGVGWVVTWPLTVVFAAMVFLSVEELRRPADTTPAIGGAGWTERFPQRIDAITTTVQQGPARIPSPLEQRQGAGNIRWVHRHYDVTIDPEHQAEIEAFITSLYDVDPGITISSAGFDGGVEVRVGLDGLLTHTLRFKWAEAAPPAPPRVALIVDMLGDDLQIARQFASLEIPVALAVRPFRPFSKEVAELARLSNREVLLHLPSSPADWNPAGAGEGSAADAPPAEMTPARHVEALLISVPHAVGVISDAAVGSEQGDAATPVLQELERRGLFRVGKGAAPPAAIADARPPAAIVSLASGDAADEAGARLARLADTARSAGVAIGVTRPTAEALEQLRTASAEWQSAGIEIVPVSGTVAPVALSAR